MYNVKGIPKLKSNFWPLKHMNILRIISFSKKNWIFFLKPFFGFFKLWQMSPPGQGEVRQESRKSASGVKKKCVGGKEKCVRGQGEVHQGSRKVLLLNVWYSAEALLLDPMMPLSLTPDKLLLDPWRTSPWPLTHFSLTWRAYFLELTKNGERKITNYFWKR